MKLRFLSAPAGLGMVVLALTTTITGLTDDTLYRWQARVLYAPLHITQPGVTPPPNPAHGPWRRLLGQAQEADLRLGITFPISNSIYLPIITQGYRSAP